ncbi:LacI family DNA-binding transcriptional regulator [Aquimarina hainanensis]|uniref:LacI family DNA-binding transcriptional regulator n=1 Tax=Aquimarina hainanensis TaxID=1578017 RepID=A0ABW5N3F6_9FLAO|nr:LacI family DNA-binding transcriptional regulator [Aquimarina sp. TRL1]QKX04351.1 LacI family DNA-binding transcriptional regulator [Aquimarina sp. TRL1]
MPNITLKEMSCILGVSISTVSKALSDSTEISKETKKRVTEIAQLYNYRPNSIAQNLRLQKTNTIGLIVPDLGNISTLELVDEIADYTMANQTKLMIYQSKGRSEREIALIKMLTNGCTDGLIISLSPKTIEKKNYVSLMNLTQANFPLVLLNKIDEIPCSKVFIDKNIQADNIDDINLPHQMLGKEAVKTLIKKINKKTIGATEKCLNPASMMFRSISKGILQQKRTSRKELC